MTGLKSAERAVGMTTVIPSAEALLAWMDEAPDPSALLHDPALLVHFYRYARPSLEALDSPIHGNVTLVPALFDTAATLYEQSTIPAQAVVLPRLLQQYIAHTVAISTNLADEADSVLTETAVATSVLALLGWTALAQLDPKGTETTLADRRHADDPKNYQLQRWGINASRLTRRLAMRWRLPHWLTATIGLLRLPVENAVHLGANRELFRIVQATHASLAQRFSDLGLIESANLNPDDSIFDRANQVRLSPTLELSRSPDVSRKLLCRMLRLTAQSRRANPLLWLNAAEERGDELLDELVASKANFAHELHAAKLAGLAEFAAGASHEINNPLAVISGQAQLLLHSESDPQRQGQLTKIIRHSKRIHDLLQGAFHFARPPAPEFRQLAAVSLVQDCLNDLRDESNALAVTLTFKHEMDQLERTIRGDREQLRRVLLHVLRNAIHAAGQGGSVEITMQHDGSHCRIMIDDSGPGPDPEYRPHLFDPFFSGRENRRGCGLGLAISWQLARNNGGDLRHTPTPDAPARFTLTLAHGSTLEPTLPALRSA